MTVLDWALLAGYFVLLIVIGVQTIRRVRTADDFAVAGNRIIWPVFFGSLAASFLGGGASLGVAGKTFSDGYVYMFAFFGYAVSFLLVGLFVAPRLKRYLGAHTVGDVMEHHYGRSARLVTGRALDPAVRRHPRRPGARHRHRRQRHDRTSHRAVGDRRDGRRRALLDVRRGVGGDPDRHAAVRLPRRVHPGDAGARAR